MLNENEIKVIEQEIEELYTNRRNMNQLSENVKGLYAATSMDFLFAAQQLLNCSKNPYCDQLCIRYFHHVIALFFTTIDENILSNMVEYLISLLRTKFMDFTQKSAKDILMLVALIYKKWWYPVRNDEKIRSRILDQMDALKTMKSALNFALLEAIIDTFAMYDDDEDSINHVFHSGESCISLAYAFSHAFAKAIATQAVDILMVATSAEEAKMALSLLCKIFVFSTEQFDAIDNNEITEVLSSMDSLCTRLTTDAKLFCSLLLSIFKQTKQSDAICVLRILCTASVDSANSRIFFVELAQTIPAMMNVENAMVNFNNHHEMCRLVCTMFQRLRITITEDISAIIITLLTTLMGFTLSSFDGWKWAPHSLHYLTRTWSKIVLISSMRSIAGIDSFFDEHIQSIVLKYMSARICNDVFDEVQDERMNDELLAFAILFFYDHKRNMPLMISLLDNIQKEVQYAWALYFASALFYSESNIRMDSSQKNDDIYVPIIVRVFCMLPSTIDEILKKSSILSGAIVYFLGFFFDRTHNHCFEYSKLEGLFTSSRDVFYAMLTFCFRVLNSETRDLFTMVYVVNLFKKCASRINTFNALTEMELQILNALFSTHDRLFLKFEHDPRIAESRVIFYNTLMDVCYCPFIKRFRNVLGLILNQLQNAPVTKIFITTLRGIVSGCTRHKPYVQFFHWMVPAQADRMMAANSDLIPSFMKLLTVCFNNFQETDPLKDQHVSFFKLFQYSVMCIGWCVNAIPANSINLSLKLLLRICNLTLAIFKMRNITSYIESMIEYREPRYLNCMTLLRYLPSLIKYDQLMSYTKLIVPFLETMRVTINYDMNGYIAEKDPNITRAFDFILRSGIKKKADISGICSPMVILIVSRLYKMPSNQRELYTPRFVQFLSPWLSSILTNRLISINSFLEWKLLYRAFEMWPDFGLSYLYAEFALVENPQHDDHQKCALIKLMAERAPQRMPWKTFKDAIKLKEENEVSTFSFELSDDTDIVIS